MGPVYGNDPDIANLISAFVCNPMEHAEASKIAIYSVADYTWNMKKYDANKAWNEGISLLMPDAAEALKKFAEHNSDMGASEHLYRREESVHILLAINSATGTLDSNRKIINKDYEALYNEFTSITEAATILMANEENKAFLAEIQPWVMQFKNIGETGLAVLDMYKALEENNKDTFVRKYNLTKSLMKITSNIDQTYNRNAFQPGVKTASLHVLPFINKLFTTAVEQYNKLYNDHLALCE